MEFGKIMPDISRQNSSENKEGTEKAAESLEHKNIKQLKDLLGRGAGRGTIASCLAGYDSREAWELRNSILAEAESMTQQNSQILKSDLAVSLAGIDSERAWEWRFRLETEDVDLNALVRSVIGLDTEAAWEIRDKAQRSLGGKDERYRNSPTLVRSIFISLIGVDSPRAWERREELWRNGAPAADYVLSLTGLNSERAENDREKFLTKSYFVSGQNLFGSVIKSTVGLEGERVDNLRLNFINNKGNMESFLDSLATDDSLEANVHRSKFFQKYQNEIDSDQKISAHHLGLSIAGLQNEQAKVIRAELLEKGYFNEVAYSLNGDLESFYAINKKLKKQLN